MKTMMELLVALQRLEHSVQTVCRRRQLTPLEVQAAQRHLDLVRDIIPAEVLAFYDQMKGTEADLLTSPEMFAMAVLVATYRSLAPPQRQQMLRHFKPHRIRTPLPGAHQTDGATRDGHRHPRVLSRQLAGQN